MGNCTPDLMKLLSAASTVVGGDLGIDTGAFLYTTRGLAWCAEYLRNFLGATNDRGPNALCASLLGQNAHGDGVAIISAAMPRLNEAWTDVPDQVLAVRKLCVLSDYADSGPPLNERDRVLLVDSILTDGREFVSEAEHVRKTGAEVVGVFVVVDLQHDGSHHRLQEADIPMCYSITTKKAIRDYKARVEMMGG